jgi:hypothetical protein
MDQAHPLAQKWRQEADQNLRRGLKDAAAMARSFAEELDAYEVAHADELLTLDEAAKESGYHKDSLSRMMSEEKIPNAGTKGAPRVRRRDLPKKPPRQPVSRTSTSGPRLVEASLADQGIVSADS